MVQYSYVLGKFEVIEVPPPPFETTQIECTFDGDANGILNMSSIVKVGGTMEKTTIMKR
jgi:L1 cell adhesion molecule like protein